VGHLLQFDPPGIHLQLEEWSRIYGPIYQLRFLRTAVIVVADPDRIVEAFRARPDTWRRMGSLEPLAREMAVHGLFTAEGADWTRQRRLVMRAFDPAHLRQFLPRLQTVIDRVRRRWQRAAVHGDALDVQTELTRYAVDAVTGLAFGIDVNTVEDGHDEINSRLEKVLPMINHRLHAVFPYWRYVRLPVDRRFDRDLAVIHQMLGDLVAQTRRQLSGDAAMRRAPSNLLQALLAAQDDDGREEGSSAPARALTDDEVIANLFTVLLAGQDTTASTLAWTLYLLHGHRDAWTRLVAEADAAARPASPPPGEAIPQLPFAQACANEAMRLHPVAPLHYLEACRDAVVGDVAVPKGTYLFCLTRVGAVDAAKLPRAKEFIPERWSDPAQEHTLKRLSLPFGAGPRMCPGRSLAMLEMRMLLSMLARDFELVDVATRHGGPAVERMDFTVHPENLCMRLQARRIAVDVANDSWH
jgi:cytochrome P450